MAPPKIALVVFVLWGLFLSGLFSSKLGTPGIIQAVRLHSLLTDKQAQIVRLQDDLKSAKAEIALLERSPVAQQREVRRVLGYAAPDELIFDFTAAERIN